MAEKRVKRWLAAIVAADVAGNLRLIRDGDTGTREGFETLRTNPLDQFSTEYGGRIFDTIGGVTRSSSGAP